MKKLILILAAAALLPIAVVARDANQMKYVGLLQVDDSGSATGPAVDVSAYKGNAAFVVAWGLSSVAEYTGTVSITHCATADGTYTTVTNLAGTAGTLTNTGVTTNKVDTFSCDLSRLHKYVKASLAEQDNETNGVSVIMVAPMKSE